MRLFDCANPIQHSPKPLVPVTHHVTPQSWVKLGARQIGTVVICGTCHDSSHDLLNAYRHSGGLPPWEYRRHFSTKIREWAAAAWEVRPNDVPPWTVVHSST